MLLVLLERSATAGVEKGLIIVPSLRRDRRPHPCSRGPWSKQTYLVSHFWQRTKISLLPILSVASFSHRVPRTPESTGNKRSADTLTGAPCGISSFLCIGTRRSGFAAKSSSPGAPWPSLKTLLPYRFFHAHQNLPPRRRSLRVTRGSNCRHISRYEECIAIDRRRKLWGEGLVRAGGSSRSYSFLLTGSE